MRVLQIVALAILCLFGLLYGRLMMGPISLNFLSGRVQAMVAGVVDDSFAVHWGDFGLSLSGPLDFAFRLSDVTLTEQKTHSVITMSALDISVSPLGMLRGRPEASIVLIGPHFQLVQDLLGTRLSRFDMVDPGDGTPAVVSIHQGADITPGVVIGSDGLSQNGSGDFGPRSDNDWLIANVESLNQSLADVAARAMAGQVDRIEVRDGSAGVLDTVYGLFKDFEAIEVELRAGREEGRVSVVFSAGIAGRTMQGTMTRSLTDEGAKVEADIADIDFSTVIPFLDDAQGIAALRGVGALSAQVDYNDEGRVGGAVFTVDLSGTALRLNNDQFPVVTEPFDVVWTPHEARFSFADVDASIGQSRGRVSGDLVLGFDQSFGPTVGLSVRASDVWLHPDDLDAPEEPFELFTFEGWTAPLYGAIGIDRMVGARENVSVVMQGRVDTVREGIGLDVTISGRGASADDLKRLWPYLFSPEVRELFTEYVIDGKVHSADMRFNFPVGTIGKPDQTGPVPPDSINIELVGSDLELQPFEGIPQFGVEGEARVTVRDNQFTMAFERGTISDPAGDIAISNAAFLNQDTSAPTQIFEISGDISGRVPTIMRIANAEPLNLLEEFQFQLDLDELAGDLDGDVEATAISTITSDEMGRMASTDYVLNGTVSNLRSTNPIEGFSFSDTQLSFTASQEGFRVVGQGKLEDILIDLQATRSGNDEADFRAAATFGVADALSIGLDLSEFIDGNVRVVTRPMSDGSFQVLADLADTGLKLTDVGIAKPRGEAGRLAGVVRLDGDKVTVADLDLAFGTVRLMGDLAVTMDGQLESAEFSTFQISPGDNARVAMTPTEGGLALEVSGEQLDIKPVLKRFFDLEGDANAGASEDLGNQTFDVRVNLARALGHYATVVYNLNVDLSVRGDELRRVNLTAQLGGDRTMSATTNALASGRVITYAANDVGAILRFAGVYPRLVGGEGSLVMRYDPPSGTDVGEFVLRDFAIAEEANLAQIVGEHRESREVLGRSGSLSFDFGRAEFLRNSDRIEVIEAALYGDTVGGTMRGNILTRSGQYDLAGTYVPLFGVNNIFQQLPILGPIFGGREGEGLLGVTFAIRGPLNQPEILVNPVSILAPGVFRTLFEYRAQAQTAP